MCTVLLPPGDNPISVNKYIIYSNVQRRWLSLYWYPAISWQLTNQGSLPVSGQRIFFLRNVKIGASFTAPDSQGVKLTTHLQQAWWAIPTSIIVFQRGSPAQLQLYHTNIHQDKVQPLACTPLNQKDWIRITVHKKKVKISFSRQIYLTYPPRGVSSMCSRPVMKEYMEKGILRKRVSKLLT